MTFRSQITALTSILLMTYGSPTAAVPWDACFDAAARLHNVSRPLLIAVARVESNLREDALSAAGAIGVMQIRWPITARHLGIARPAELYNPCLNIDLGARYLAELLRRYEGNQRYALAAYNYGPGRIRSGTALPRGAARYADRVEAHLAPEPTPTTSPAAAVGSKEGPATGLLFTREFRARAYARAMRRLTATTMEVDQLATGAWRVRAARDPSGGEPR